MANVMISTLLTQAADSAACLFTTEVLVQHDLIT